ncbi:MAG: porin family protein [Gammaproteobacteria bacterium]|nr:porin family protein [Gammaproteobacteria bacterium]
MNLKRIFLIAASLSILGNSAVQAETPPMYWGVGYSSVNYTTSPIPDPTDPLATITEDLDPASITLKGGIAIGNWLGIEVQYGLTKESRVQPSNIGSKLELQQGAAFARFNFPFPRVNAYALAGVAVVDVDTGDAGLINRDDTYVAGGLGLDLMASEQHMLYLEALRYEHEDGDSNDPSVNIITIGYKYHFEFAGVR